MTTLVGIAVLPAPAGAIPSGSLQPDSNTVVGWTTGYTYGLGWGSASESIPTPDSLAGKRVTHIAGGLDVSLAITDDGALHSWGTHGENPIPDSLQGQRFVDVAAGRDHCLATSESGEVHTWWCDGREMDDTDYQIPEHLRGQRITAIDADRDYSAAVTEDGRAHIWGPGTMPLPASGSRVPGNLDSLRVVDIAVGLIAFTVLTEDGDAYWWQDHQTEARLQQEWGKVTSIAAASQHEIAVTTNRTVVQWGVWNGNGLLEPETPEGIADVVSADIGIGHAIALRENGSVDLWSADGVGDEIPDLVAEKGAVAVAAGTHHSLAIIDIPSSDDPPAFGDGSAVLGSIGSTRTLGRRPKDKSEPVPEAQ